jgi:hypothetical protein
VLALVHRGALRALWPLDWLRAQWFALLGSRFAWLHRDRASRIVVVASLAIALSLTLTLFAPLVLFTLGPVLIGVPHLVSDVRYLVLKPKLHLQKLRTLAIVLPLLALQWNTTPVVGLLAALLAVITSAGPLWQKVLISFAIALLMLIAYRAPYESSLFVAHAHNVVAIGFAFLIFAPHMQAMRLRALGLTPFALYCAASALLLSGALDALLFRQAALSTGWLEASDAARWYVPAQTEALFSVRVLAWFVFSQSVHYACWLRVIPEAARTRAGLRGFRSSFNALVSEFSLPVLIALALLSLALFAYALHSGFEIARLQYLKFAFFHGYLEFAVLAVWLTDASFRTRLRAGIHNA